MSKARTGNKPGRNDPCPCGSGLKYKKCCGRSGGQAAATTRGVPPSSAGALFEQSQFLYRSGRLVETGEILSQVLAVDPGHAAALHLLGVVRHQLGDPQQAKRFLSRAVSRAPREPAYRNSYGEVLRLSGAYSEALTQFDKALALSPGYENAANNRALALFDLGRVTEAVTGLKGALDVHPRSATLHDNLGYVLQATGDFAEAAAHHERALSITPDLLSARVNLGSARQSQGKYVDAMACYESVPRASEAEAAALHNLGICYQELGDIEQAITHMGKALALEPGNADLLGDYVFARHHTSPQYSAELLELSIRWANMFESVGAAAARQTHRPSAAGAKLTIGYLSPFALASTRYFNESVITRHSETLDVFYYATSPYAALKEPWSRVPRSRWRDISRVSDEEADRRIRKDRVDILVDLAGNVRGHRLGVLARKPAPVAMTWTESFYTTGCRHIDYFIGDECSSPEGLQPWFIEELVTLPDVRFCYTPPAYAPAAGPSPKQRNGYVTFGCFTHVAKITPEVVEVWARILVALRDAKLILKWKAYAEAAARERILGLFAPHGVTADRIDFRSQSEHRAMLAEYGDVDIALDTFPYNGGLTTGEALWMGVPVLCVLGDTVIGRQSACMLKAVGCEDTVAETRDAYVQRAIALASDGDALAALRAQLRERMARSPLCDAEAFVRALESLYSTIWRQRSLLASGKGYR